MEPEVSLPHSQVPAIYSFLENIDPGHTPTPHFLKIHLNIILPSTSGSPQWSLCLTFTHQNTEHATPQTHYMHRPSHSSRFYQPHNMWGITGSSLCSFLHCPVTSSPIGPNILLNALFSNTICHVVQISTLINFPSTTFEDLN